MLLSRPGFSPSTLSILSQTFCMYPFRTPYLHAYRGGVLGAKRTRECQRHSGASLGGMRLEVLEPKWFSKR